MSHADAFGYCCIVSAAITIGKANPMLACVCQVEPVQWSADHSRTVLSSAIVSPNTLCSPPMIEAARLAVQGGYEGTMHRQALQVLDGSLCQYHCLIWKHAVKFEMLAL